MILQEQLKDIMMSLLRSKYCKQNLKLQKVRTLIIKKSKKEGNIRGRIGNKANSVISSEIVKLK